MRIHVILARCLCRRGWLLGLGLGLSMAVPGWASGAPEASRLNWGRLLSYEGAPALPAELAAVLREARATMGMPIETAAAFHIAGNLTQDPRRQESTRAKAAFPVIFDWAVCARIAPEPLRGQCLAKATDALMAWAQAYRPAGNPIDENFFVPLFQAIDLIAPRVTADTAHVLLDWVRAFATAGDRFYAPKVRSDTALSNNWMAQRLLVRATAAVVCDDAQLQASTRDLLSDFAGRNFLSEGGRQDGTTFDFVQRDALEYQVADLMSLVQIVLYTPSLVTAPVRVLIDRGLNFLKDFYTGARQHIEFANTTNSFDVKRKLEDAHGAIFQNKPWDPAEANILLRLARPAFPDIRPWTANVPAAHYSTRVSLLAAMYGDPSQAE